MTDIVLEAKKVSKTYTKGGFFSRAQNVEVLRGIDIALQAGECVGLVGRSGAGKSTLGRILLGLEAPSMGSVEILGRPTAEPGGRLVVDSEQRRAVQIVFQDAIGSVNPRFTAGNILAEPVRNFFGLTGKALGKRIAELLSMVGLRPEDSGKYPAQFSGGQLQRVSIARALAAEPECIILDEAVSSLDMLVQAKILDLLDDLRRQRNVAYLFVTHDLRLIRHFCDRALVIENKQLHEFDHRDFKKDSHLGILGELAGAMLPAMPA